MNDQQQPARPSVPLTDPQFVYRNSAQTNVQDTWRRFGWVPPAHDTVPMTYPVESEEGGEL